MTDMNTEGRAAAGTKAGRFFGSLRDALAAAGRADLAADGSEEADAPMPLLTPPPIKAGQDGQTASATTVATRAADVVDIEEVVDDVKTSHGGQRLSAKEAADAARGSNKEPATPQVIATHSDRHVEFDTPPTTGVIGRGNKRDAVATADNSDAAAAQTQLVRGRAEVKRGSFEKDPVVGWLVVVGGPGLGNYRPVFEGNNTVGRDPSQRIAIDFGDDAISSKEQAFIRYDSAERSFLFVPNLSKTNIVSVNDKRPTGAVSLTNMDVITIGRTQLVFVPFCGPDFDWSELPQS